MNSKPKVLILGGDGYLGWPTAMHFTRQGYQVAIADNMSKRVWEAELGTAPLWSIPLVHKRVRLWKDKAGHEIKLYVGDIAQNHRFVYKMFEEFRPDAVVHYAEQPSAPYSMHSREKAVNTQINNVAGNLNVLFAMRKYTPDAHLVKLGTMGEYGTPNIDIEEGWLDIEHKGRKDRVLFPKKPGSFYHLSKVHDSHNIEFACRIWGLRATDLNQGVVYGIETEETKMHPELLTSFHYDDVFGTALNRFCVQAVAGVPLTVYGQGGQKRGFLNIRDTLQCVQIAVDNPAKSGEFRVFNQFTEVFSVLDLAKTVQKAGEALGMKVAINNIPNPRVEAEQHYYNPKNDSLLALGLKPRQLSGELVNSMLVSIQKSKDQIEHHTILPKITWKQ
ncbi:MAG: NAD-dependent epimerase/dehydratase family protein [Patescibacteria group bacterium]